jgi:modulator of FtsH protease HflC
MRMTQKLPATPDEFQRPSGRFGLGPWITRNGRILVAGFVVVIALLAACAVLVVPGEAVVMTRLGNPVRVMTAPGLAWKIPAPIEGTIPVDLRLKTTSSGLQDVGTRDGLRILVQAYVAWRVPDDAEHIRQFLRAVRNQPDVAADQLRSFIGSSLEITVSGFDLTGLMNTDASKIQLALLESRLLRRIDEQALKVYGIEVLQVGIERLTLPSETLTATVARMAAERETVAAAREAEGERAAAEITSNANRDARVLLAQAKADAASIDAKSRVQAADIYAKAYSRDRQLYTLLRSLDTLSTVIRSNTTLILRSDAAPFRILVDGPGKTAGTLPAQTAQKP